MFATTATKERSIFTQFYTHSRTREILEGKGIKVRKIEKVSIHKPSGEFYRCVQVVYTVVNGQRCSTFVSCKDYLSKAYGDRKERSKEYTAYQDREHSTYWTVVSKVIQMPLTGDMATSGKEGKARTVTTVADAVVCDCEDFANQPYYLQEHPYLWYTLMKERRVCKHVFTTLDALGFGSLRDYLAAWKPEGRLSKLSATMNQQSRKRFSSTLNKRAV